MMNTKGRKQVTKFQGFNKKQRGKERKIALEQRLSEIKALAKKHKDSEKQFQNNNWKLYYKYILCKRYSIFL